MEDHTSPPVTHFRPHIEIRYLIKTAKLQHSKKSLHYTVTLHSLIDRKKNPRHITLMRPSHLTTYKVNVGQLQI